MSILMHNIIQCTNENIKTCACTQCKGMQSLGSMRDREVMRERVEELVVLQDGDWLLYLYPSNA